METLFLQRFAHLEDGTFGRLVLPTGDEFYTVERPWKANQARVSCIPAKTYMLGMRDSPMVARTSGYKHARGWEVRNVPDRSYIMIHPANWSEQLEGCIAVGTKFSIMKNPRGDAEHGVQQSRVAFNRFMAAMDPELEYKIQISDFYSTL